MKFELNPITLRGPKIGGKFFGPVTQNLLFGHNKKISLCPKRKF